MSRTPRRYKVYASSPTGSGIYMSMEVKAFSRRQAADFALANLIRDDWSALEDMSIERVEFLNWWEGRTPQHVFEAAWPEGTFLGWAVVVTSLYTVAAWMASWYGVYVWPF